MTTFPTRLLALASLLVLLEAGTVVAVLSVTVMGSQLPADLLWWRIDPAAAGRA